MSKKLLIAALLLTVTNVVFATVPADETKRQYFVCNGSTTTFTFTAPCNSSDDISVYKRLISTGAEGDPLTEDTDYTITNTGSSYLEGGVVTIDPAVASTYQLVIIREIVQTQETVSGAINPVSIVAALDKLQRQIQDIRYDLAYRFISIPQSDADTLEMEIANSKDRADKYAAYDSVGNPIAVETVAEGSLVTTAYGETFIASATALIARGILEIGPADFTSTLGLADVITKAPWVDVRAWATCDGTTDDAVALQAALDSMTSGGTLLIPGVCAIGSTSWVGITVTSKSDITIRGVGAGSGFKVLVAPSQTLESIPIAIMFVTCTNIKFENIDFDGNSISTTLLGLSGCETCSVDNNKFHDTASASTRCGIIATGGTGNKFTRNIIHDVQNGMLIGNTNPGKTEDNAIISKNVIFDTFGTCIGGTLDGGTISNNQCFDGGNSGIALGTYGTEPYQNTTITGNVCKGCVTTGIQADGIGDTKVQGVTITGNICLENGADGILVANITDSTISGNVCRDNNYGGIGNGYGIHVATFAKRLAITGNYCYDTRSGASRTQVNGIQINSGSIADGVNNIVVTANFCYNNSNNGLHVTNAGSGTVDQISLRGNFCFSNGVRGLSVADAVSGDITGVTAIGNTCYDNVTADFRFDPIDTISLLNDGNGDGANVIRLVSTTVSVNLAVSADTEATLYTVPTGKTFMPVKVVLRTFSADEHGTPPIITFGTGSTTAEDFLGDQTLSNITANYARESIILQPLSNATPVTTDSIVAAGTFVMEITQANGAALTCTIDVFGYLY